MFANAGISSILDTCFISLSCVNVMTLLSYEGSKHTPHCYWSAMRQDISEHALTNYIRLPI